MRNTTLIAAMLISTSTAIAAEAPVEVRFCPAAALHSYPLDTMHDTQSALLQNTALINRSNAPVTVDSLEIALERVGQTVDVRRYSGDDLAKMAKGGVALQASGMMQLVAFQFCGTALLGTAQLSPSTTLAPGSAVLIAHQPFAYKGARDRLRVTAYADAKHKVAGEGTIPITDATAKTALKFPLTGAWYVAAGQSFHTAHRWALPEEFGLDLVKIDGKGLTHRGDGTAFADYFAYGEKIFAPAAGKVVLAITNEAEDTTALRRRDETQEAYFERLQQDQAKRLMRGLPGVIGNGVVIDHGNGEYSLLAHMKPGSVTVKTGDTVTQGQLIGALGSSGNSTEPHLHYQVCDSADPLLCAGIPITFTNTEVTLTDLPRPIQSGDMVIAK